MNIPGKKPARKTPTGNLLHVEVWAAEEVRLVESGFDVAVELEVDVEEAVGELLEEEEEVPFLLVLAMMLQTLFPSGDRMH
jgi:hypothetical protein